MLNIRNMIHHPAVVLICRIVLGSVFIYASADKIMHPESFASILHNYQLLPDFLIYAPALFLPWIELVAGAFLIAGIFPRGASFILNGLLVIFIIAIAFNLARGLNFDCGCFSTQPGSGDSAYFLLFRDLLLLIPGIILFLNYNYRRTNESKN